MGFWDSLSMSVFDIIASSDNVRESLDKASLVLETAEYVWDDERIAKYRKAVDRFSNGIATGQAVVKDVSAAYRLFAAARMLPTDVRSDPDRAAREFGKMFAALGDLAHLLPFPFGAYFEIFQGAENFFVNIKAQMDPRVHMREPGIREVIDNLP